MATQNNNSQNPYDAGHPWYYRLGGAVHKPKAILKATRDNKYQGYNRDNIHQADDRAEPQRSSDLRLLREGALKDFRTNIAIYRKYACELREYRLLDEAGQKAHDDKIFCSDIHLNMSLKYCHLYNDLAHLYLIDDLLSYQADLFA